jgi:LPXTG-motif cell wall-anchored protein
VTTAIVSVPPTRLPELPHTGASSLDLAGIGLGLVIAGVFLRRRGRHV